MNMSDREALIREHDALCEQYVECDDASQSEKILERIGNLEIVLFYGDFES